MQHGHCTAAGGTRQRHRTTGTGTALARQRQHWTCLNAQQRSLQHGHCAGSNGVTEGTRQRRVTAGTALVTQRQYLTCLYAQQHSIWRWNRTAGSTGLLQPCPQTLEAILKPSQPLMSSPMRMALRSVSGTAAISIGRTASQRGGTFRSDSRSISLASITAHIALHARVVATVAASAAPATPQCSTGLGSGFAGWRGRGLEQDVRQGWPRVPRRQRPSAALKRVRGLQGGGAGVWRSAGG